MVSSETSLLPDGKDLNNVPLRVLEAETRRLESLTKKFANAKAQLDAVRNDTKDAADAQVRIEKLSWKRSNDYFDVFNAILAEESAL